MSKVSTSWYSARVERDVRLTRWGEMGRPVLVFPTAGGDSEEIERWHLVGACAGLLAAGRIKIYSVDSVDGRVLIDHEGDSLRQAYIQRQFFQYIRHEVVPAVRADCASDGVELIAAGASIGAFNALGCITQFPDVFGAAVCMSGTFDLARFYDGPLGDDFYASSAVHLIPYLSGWPLDALRRRFVILASGEGEHEDIGESWHAAHVLGTAGVPNRVDPWGPHWAHDWPLWRAMLPGYLGELC